MTKIFLTKVWGFSPETYPALGFNSEGARNKYLKESKPGDWVLMAGTRGKPTNSKDQGRLLGKVQLGTDQINVEEVIKSIGTEIPADHYNDDGRYKWPFGLPMLKAFRFIGAPDLSELFGDYLPGTQWASYALDIQEKLGEEAITKVLSLKVEKANIIDAPAIIRQRERHDALVLNRTKTGKTGPEPSDSRSGSNNKRTSASTYLLQLYHQEKPKNIFKVGYSSDTSTRLSDLNKGLLPTVTKYCWKLILTQEFQTAKHAYDYEQLIHKRLHDKRVENEQEIYSTELKFIRSAWSDILYRMEWTTPETENEK